MYLPRSSKWSMTRRRKRPNLFGWAILGLVVLFGYYFDQVYLPAQPNPFEATPTPTRSPESFVTEAQELFTQGKLLQTIDAYQSAINASPQNPALYIAMARVQVLAGKPQEAQANAENAILLNPENSMAHAVRAWALDFQDGKNGDALDEIDKAIEYDDHNALAHAYRVEILVDSDSADNIVKAIEESKVALALDPNAMETHRARGYLYSATGNYVEAIGEYQQAIAINPNISILHIELGKNYRIVQVYDKAVDEFIRANTLNPSDSEPDFLISRTYATMGDYTKALQYAETAIKDKPTDAKLRGNYGVMYYRNYEYQKALAQLSLAVHGGRNEAGLEIMGLPLTNDSRIAEYYFTYGLALARLNQCGEALQIAQELQTKFSADETTMEAASRIIEICQENLNNPAVDTPVPSEIETLTPTATP